MIKKKIHPNWSDEQIKKTTILYPQTDSFGGEDEIFVRGIGRKKFGKTNKIIVPTFSGNIEDWDNYLNTYGKECLFYSLSGYSLYDTDCCAYKSECEFYSLLQCNGGIRQYQKFVENIKEIQNIQTKIITEKLSHLSDYLLKDFIEKNIVRPLFNIYFLTISPYVDTLLDDDKMVNFYRKYRMYEILLNHSDYKRMVELEALMKEVSNSKDNNHSIKYNAYYNEYCTIKSNIRKYSLDIVDNEIKENVKFPICMEERMSMLFGDKCKNLYNYILNHFKD